MAVRRSRPLPSAAPTVGRRRAGCTKDDGGLVVRFDRPERRVAPGQTVALYDPTDPESVLGAGIAR